MGDAKAADGPRVERFAVVGAGTMGAGIAALACAKGIATVLCDVDESAVRAGVERVEADLARGVQRGRLSDDEARAARARLTASADLSALADADLVLEAIVERLEPKRELLARVAAIAPGAVLASNTSSLPIAALSGEAGGAPRERLLGLHFFNPPRATKLVELIATPSTAPAAVARARGLAEALGKLVVEVADGPGFLVNRCARPYYLEALKIVEREEATPAEVDAACEQAGFPTGPFRLMDLIGIDVSLAVTRSMFEQSGGEPRWRPSPLQEQLVAAGRLGRKSGRGFYADGESAPAEPAPEALERIVAQLVNEAWFAIDAGVANAHDIDLAMTAALGYPRGPIAWGETWGHDRVIEVLERLAREDDPARYRVAPSLRIPRTGQFRHHTG